MSKSRLLEGKLALVTGAGRGIGRAVAETFARHGADVLVNARTPNSVDGFCAELSAAHDVRCAPLYGDISSADAVKEMFSHIQKTHKRLDALVNNAGILRDALFAMTPVATMHEVFATNVMGTMYCAQYASRLMSRQKSGSIINVSSIIGVSGNEGQVVYGASKAAVIGLTKSLAKEVGASGVRVNAVAPGFIETDMIKEVPPAKSAKIMENIKMGRLGSPQDIANACLFLASDLSDYVTGQVLGVDGGMII